MSDDTREKTKLLPLTFNGLSPLHVLAVGLVLAGVVGVPLGLLAFIVRFMWSLAS